MDEAAPFSTASFCRMKCMRCSDGQTYFDFKFPATLAVLKASKLFLKCTANY